jgi:Flp pilus assembly pilin Flp
MRPDRPNSAARALRRAFRRAERALRRAAADESGATTLEWTLLLAAIGIPSYWIIKVALATLINHYQMMTTINSLPFP